MVFHAEGKKNMANRKWANFIGFSILGRAADWSRKVDGQKSNIFSYIVFLRITPFLPNWFINIVSPVIGVRLPPFWLGTFVGVAPPSFIAIQVRGGGVVPR